MAAARGKGALLRITDPTSVNSQTNKKVFCYVNISCFHVANMIETKISSRPPNFNLDLQNHDHHLNPITKKTNYMAA